VRLASSPAYPNQAFRFGHAAYGVQFHLEVSAEMAREWAVVPEYIASLERTLGAEGAPAFLAAVADRADEMRSAGRTLFERWLSTLSR
jgi:GMP synthase-like glutamine amidotransferase